MPKEEKPSREAIALLGEFIVYLEEILNRAGTVLLWIFVGLMVDLRDRYVISSNRESGFGRYDIILMPKGDEDHVIIIEFKVYDADTKYYFMGSKSYRGTNYG